VFFLLPEKGFLESMLYFLEACPHCGSAVAQVYRIDVNMQVSSFRKANKKAFKLFENLKKTIKFEEKIKFNPLLPSSSFYLYYNEYGKKKKCYSNLNTLEIGRFDPDKGLNIAKNPFLT
jgi:glutaredoxin-related protein